MPKARALARHLLLGTLLSGCTLPGAISPTPFTFPTPDLTLTAVFAPTASVTPEVTPEATPPPTATLAGGAATAAPLPSITPRQAVSRPNGVPLEATFMGTPPDIDGELSDWTSPAFRADSVVFGAAAWSGVADLSADFYLGWDTRNLYLAVVVTDDAFVQVATGGQIYQGDIVELQIDTALAEDFETATLSNDDYQIGLSPGDFSDLGAEAYRWFPRSVAGPLTGVVVKAARTADGYVLEAAVPWETFGLTPTEGGRYGFALSVSDNDTAGTAVQESMVSSVGTRLLLDPTTWGTLVLAPPKGK